MNKIGRKSLFLILGILFLQFGNLISSYGYVEPAKSILPKSTTTELSNPDLPKRKGVEVGNVVFHSAVSTGVTIDPNIYLASQDEKYDIINTLEASFGLEIPIQEHKISLDYLAQQYFFERYNFNDHLDQQVRGLLELNFTDYRVTLNEAYRKYEDLPGTDNTSRLKEDDNNVRLGVTHETDKFAFDIGYSNIVHHFFSDDPIFSVVTNKDRDYMLHVSDISVGYKILPKTSIVLENDYGFSEHKSQNSPDYYFDDILIGVKGQLHPNLTTTLLAGWRYQYFNKSPILYDATASKFICRGAVKYAFSDKDVFDAAMERTVNDSLYQDVTYYTTNFLSLGYTHFFTDKLSSRLFTSYQRNMYPTETTEIIGGNSKTAARNDNAYGAGINLHYDIRRWLSAEIGYEFKQADSNFVTFSYNDNIATFKVSAGF
jgi:hypothetical protein